MLAARIGMKTLSENGPSERQRIAEKLVNYFCTGRISSKSSLLSEH